MKVDDILRVVESVQERTQLPGRNYDILVSSDDVSVEMELVSENEPQYSILITSDTIRVLYAVDYDSDKYEKIKYYDSIDLLYYLSIFLFMTISLTMEITFNQLLSFLLLNEVNNWKDLILAICENINLNAEITEDGVEVEGITIAYNDDTHTFFYDENKFVMEDISYTSFVRAVFAIVSYIAGVMDIADTLFDVEEIEEEIPEMSDEDEEEGPIGGMGGGAPDDFEDNFGPPPVDTMDMETFEEPTEAVVTPDDTSDIDELIE